MFRINDHQAVLIRDFPECYVASSLSDFALHAPTIIPTISGFPPGSLYNGCALVSIMSAVRLWREGSGILLLDALAEVPVSLDPSLHGLADNLQLDTASLLYRVSDGTAQLYHYTLPKADGEGSVQCVRLSFSFG